MTVEWKLDKDADFFFCEFVAGRDGRRGGVAGARSVILKSPLCSVSVVSLYSKDTRVLTFRICVAVWIQFGLADLH